MTTLQTSFQEQTIPDQATNWSATLDFQQFNSSLGALTGVGVGVTGDVVGSIFLANLDLAPATFGVLFASTINVAQSGGPVLASVAPEASDSVSVAAGSSTTLANITGSASTQVNYQTSANPGAPSPTPFIGTGSVPLSVSTQSNLLISGPGNLALVSQQAAGASVTLQYNYAPANTGNGPSGGAGVTTAFATGSFITPAGSLTTTSQTFSFADRTTGWNDSAAVNQFDPGLGTLEAVNIFLNGDLVGAFAAENLGTTAASVVVNDAATLTLDLPDGTSTLSATASTSDQMSLSTYDGSADFGGSSGQTDTLSVPSSSAMPSHTSLHDATDLAAFTGQGVVVLPISATSAATISGPGNLAAGLLTDAGATASASYTYLPAPTGTGAAEPTSPGTRDYLIFDTSTNQWDTTTTPIAGAANNDLFDRSGDNLFVTVSSDNWVIGTGGGNDAIMVHGGNNVLDGGTGSNFLIGAGGDDTFSVQSRRQRRMEHGRQFSSGRLAHSVGRISAGSGVLAEWVRLARLCRAYAGCDGTGWDVHIGDAGSLLQHRRSEQWPFDRRVRHGRR
jgi:hypothetical protein